MPMMIEFRVDINDSRRASITRSGSDFGVSFPLNSAYVVASGEAVRQSDSWVEPFLPFLTVLNHPPYFSQPQRVVTSCHEPDPFRPTYPIIFLF